MARPFSKSAGDATAAPTTVEFWQSQITAAKSKRDKLVPFWKENIQRYLAKTLTKLPTADTIVVPLDYANAEQKKALLFFRVPEVQLTPKKPAFETAVPVFQAALNHTLGRHGVDAKTMMNEVLFDAIVPAGLAVTMIGYEPTVNGTRTIQVGERPATPEELPPGAVLGLGTPMVPVMGEVPNIIHEAYYWSRISPEKVLIPADFAGSNYDLSPWLGYDFEIDHAVAVRKGWIPADFQVSTSDRPIPGLNESEQPEAEGQRLRVTGTVLWYRMAHFDPAAHPDAFGTCVLIDGMDDFAVTPGPSKWQKFTTDPASGKTTLIGMKGNPIHIKGTRYVSDSAYPPSDVTMGRPQVDELSKGRSQMIRQRERNIPIRGYDRNRVDSDIVKKIAAAEEQSLIGFDGNPNEQLAVLGTGQLPRENFEFDKIAKQDYNSTWALGSNQRAQDNDEGSKTATEASIIQSNTDTRLAYEQDAWLDWYVRGAEKLGGLLQLFADDQDYVEIVGEDGVQKLVPWDKTVIAGEFAYTAVPDTAIRQDATTIRKRALDFFNLMANEPHIDRGELVRNLLRELNKPLKLFKADLPEKGPEPMRTQLTIRSEDLSPAAPAFPVLKAILEQQGLQVPDDAISMGLALQSKVDQGGVADPSVAGVAQPGAPMPGQLDTLNGGPAQEVSPINKRAFNASGQLPGAGSATAAVN